MSKKALIVHGGWEGHDPVEFSEFFRDFLKDQGYEVEVSDTLKSFEDEKKLMGLDLIIPHWTNGTITLEQYAPVVKAVMNGVGLAGIHGGMCDAFHDCMDWQFMTGSQWVAHAGGQRLPYTVNIKHGSHEIVEGLEDFKMESEQYYIHIDPAAKVLATTRMPVGKGPFMPNFVSDIDPESGYGVWNFDLEGASEGPHVLNGSFDMPVAYIKYYGKGRVFYTSLGHIIEDLKEPQLVKLMQRGLLWASK
jgi:type 1 glutamine amidotransferase